MNPDGTLQRLIDGKPVDLDIPLVRSDSLKASFLTATDQWRFVAPWFRRAAMNRSCKPVMPFLAYATLTVGRIPSIDLVCRVLDVETARVYQFWTAWLRELHVGLYLSYFGDVAKNLQADLAEGTDWIFRRDGEETRIAVTHQGAASGRYWWGRKEAKSGGNVVLVAPCRGAGVHFVPTSDIATSCLKNWSSSPI